MKTKLHEKVQKETPDGDGGLKQKKYKKPKKNEDTLDVETKVETMPPKKKLEKRKIQNEDPEGEEISKKKLKKIQQDSTDDDSEAEQKKTTKKKMKSYESQMDDLERERTVFVGNLPLSTTRKDLEKLFSSCGKIESVRLRSAIPKEDKMLKKVAVIKQQFSDEIKDNINGYVKFVDKYDVEKALKLNGTMFGGHHMQVDSCSKDQKYDSKYSIFVGNLSFLINEDQMIEHFSDCGDIERVRIVRDKFAGRGKGIGFVVFKDETSVDLALKLNGEDLNGRPLRIMRVVKKFKKFIDGKNKQKPGEQEKDKGKKFKKKKKTVPISLMD